MRFTVKWLLALVSVAAFTVPAAVAVAGSGAAPQQLAGSTWN